ncbi:2-amino-4-hydroxy-6-hydroxymethyldihydropteridine diphosphokinase [Extensimonas vulgaris]|uniref:2-amino-4-hydroxy-6-hydroxymethyldihydropteridine pyrophosphokinase n=2 Tax=Extensimonas vulgaris TaxID=1031594 RepID=A0A369AKA2_9BURK|nr:2-amino-4-hydroxy-6-hydroxymethyldihydropteridine diphosphokinase [Extensimonas vulgaris]TWI39420.1 2-amino-4-hydroxy-6-hydroxymethyldihydropteridine diphosphokinase [Extensimonas vulgaris]
MPPPRRTDHPNGAAQNAAPPSASPAAVRMVEAVSAGIGLGANLGDCAATLRQALQGIAALPGTQLLRQSSLYRSAPVAATGPDYVNAVAEILTTLSPQALLQALQNLEHAAGRERPYRNAPRTLDLDILWWGELQLHTPTLTVPHPRMHERAFVLLPLAEIAPERVTPEQLRAVQGQRVERLG